MSAETVVPPEGPAGPEQELQPQESSRLLLESSQDTCSNENKESSAAAETERILASREHSADEQREEKKEENHTNGDIVRTQPQPLPQSHPAACLQQPSEGEGARLHNGLHAGLSNGHRMPRGGTQPAAAAAAASSSESRKHPSPVSQRMQKKLRSSLSVNSDSSRRSKGSSTGSHKPGSSPEDCCVHCILACLFCEFLTLCNMVVAQASCGTCTSEACCCCCCADDLGDDCNCPCDMDCGIMDACCESSDCLEICMECCGICFPT